MSLPWPYFCSLYLPEVTDDSLVGNYLVFLMFQVGNFLFNLDMKNLLLISELLDSCQEKRFVSQDASDVYEEEQSISSKSAAPKGGFQTKRLSIISESTVLSDSSIEVDWEKEEIVLDSNCRCCAAQDATCKCTEGTNIFEQKSNEHGHLSIDISNSRLDEKKGNIELFWDQQLKVKSNITNVCDGSSKSLDDVCGHSSEPQLHKMGSLSSLGDSAEDTVNAQCLAGVAKSNGSLNDLPTLGNGCNEIGQKKQLFSSKSHENIASKKSLRRAKSPLAKQLSEKSLRNTAFSKICDSWEGKIPCHFYVDDLNDSDDDVRQSDASRSSSTTSFSTNGSGYSRVYKKV